MDFLPVFLRLQGQRALVVGGGAVALRKAGMLLRAGARICLVAPQISAELRILLDDGKGHELWQREFAPEDLDEVKLVVAATDDQAVNEAVYQYASARNLPVNVVDNPALCSFIFPSIVDRSPLLVAVSSG